VNNGNIYFVEKCNCNEIAKEFAVHTTTCGRCWTASFSSFYIHSKLILPTWSS